MVNSIINLGLISVLSLPICVNAFCGGGIEKTKNMFEALEPIISNYDRLDEDEDGKVYGLFGGDLETINGYLRSPPNFYSSINQEPLYHTVEDAMRYKLPDAKYIIEFDLNNEANRGKVSGGYTATGERLGVLQEKCGSGVVILIDRN